MKKLIILTIFLTSGICYSQSDSTEIRQEIFFSEVLNKYGLITNNGELYDSVVHGSLEFVESQKPIEFEKALRRRKTVAIVKIKCK